MKAALCGFLALLIACASPTSEGPLVWVNVRTIEMVGLDDQDRAAILQLKVPLRVVKGGFVDGRDGPSQILLTIAELGSGVERRLEGSAIQLLVETIAAYFASQNRLGVRADVKRGDFDRMRKGDTRLRIRIFYPPGM
jgi:hypothetical protein